MTTQEMTAPAVAEAIELIPREQLVPGPWQPRRTFDPESLAELAASLREDGVRVPLRVVVREPEPINEERLAAAVAEVGRNFIESQRRLIRQDLEGAQKAGGSAYAHNGGSPPNWTLAAELYRNEARQMGLDVDLPERRAIGESVRITVRGVDEPRYHILAGERRWRAAAIAEIDELPCIVEDGAAALDHQTLRRRALIDNLHRADLVPGEEARALGELAKGLSQREIAAQIGKSQPYVQARLALLKLPQAAIEALDNGVIIAEDAREMVKIARWPEWVEACLDPKGEAIKRDIGLWAVHRSIAERAKAYLDKHAADEERRKVVEKLVAEGKTVLDHQPEYGDKRYVMLTTYGAEGQAHDAAGLACVAYWAAGPNSVHRYCDDPAALRKAAVAENRESQPLSEWEIKRRAEDRQKQARARARDKVIAAWAVGTTAPWLGDATAVVRMRIEWLVGDYWGDKRLAQVGAWLGLAGNADERVREVRERLRGAGESTNTSALWRLWQLVEIAHGVQQGEVIPRALVPWLEEHGYADPCEESAAGEPAEQLAGEAEGLGRCQRCGEAIDADAELCAGCEAFCVMDCPLCEEDGCSTRGMFEGAADGDE